MGGKIESPCVQVCDLGEDGRCEGCGRTLQQIAEWESYSPERRNQIIHKLKQLGYVRNTEDSNTED